MFSSLSRFAAAFLVLLAPLAARAADTAGDCHIGAYRLADGRLIHVGASTGDALRWRAFDGTTGALHPGKDGRWTSTLGWTDRPDGVTARFSPCPGGEMSFGGVAGRRVDLDVAETSFTSKGVRLAGRLVMPKGSAAAPIVVLVHGSERYSGRDFYPLQGLLPAEGVGVFVYDKRGTGASSGAYTQDFDILADDAAAALDEARRLAGPRAGRIGFDGGSQGGWIAPLAASRTHADFVIVGFGLAVSPLDEDREEVALDMRRKGHSAAETAEAVQLSDAAGKIMASGFTKGFARFDALRDRHRGAPWLKDVGGDYTGEMLPLSDAQLHAKAGDFLVGAPMRYDPMPVLRELDTPQLWMLAADDIDAPSAETSRRLKALAAAGRPITVVMFPHAGHGILEYEEAPDGVRTSIRYAEGYHAMTRDFARGGRLGDLHGTALIAPAKGAGAPARRRVSGGSKGR